ncbi:DedA family protein [Palleronia sp. LCG004]|uniref:DedA family protein n=1 Tax=Palleronia sp. LCG004 TaxID=3079304 RepID=UPI00294396A3|nr:VTT domain-containing protein [Palleronia sp. LCG004]WOI57059.1 VTT domain-containing protein [Palleronia sp. LCG004]
MIDIDPILAEHGAWLVFVGTTISGDTVALAAGVLEQRGTLRLGPTLAAVAAGGWVSDVGLFLLGKQFRRSRRVARALDQPVAQRLNERFMSRPVLLTAISRFIPGSRTFVPVALATSGNIGLPLYAAVSAVASAIWAWLLLVIGHNLGEWIAEVWGRIRETETIVTFPAIAIALSLGTLIWRLWRRKKHGTTIVPRFPRH